MNSNAITTMPIESQPEPPSKRQKAGLYLVSSNSRPRPTQPDRLAQRRMDDLKLVHALALEMKLLAVRIATAIDIERSDPQ